MTEALFRVDPRDDVAVALRDLAAGEMAGIRIAEPVPKGHKVALRSIAAGAEVSKYGFPIGRALTDIAVGTHVHSHNLATALDARGDYVRNLSRRTQPAVPAVAEGFLGYRRADIVPAVTQLAARLPEAPLDELIKAALKELSRGAA